MKIHYSPYFNGEKYIDFKSRNNIVFDEIFVGDKGLLSELELRAGLSCETLSGSEREANYYMLIKKTLENKKESFIKDSFKVDEYGVAGELIAWRDDLVLAGWTGKIKGISEKLDLFAEIEEMSLKEDVVIKGESDRWRNILSHPDSFMEADDSFIIHFPEKFLPPWIKSLINRLRNENISCLQRDYDTPLSPETSNLHRVQSIISGEATTKLDPADTQSFKILEFERHSSALEYIAAMEYNEDTAFINSDNREFDLHQELLGQPISGSKLYSANPEIVQIFKLGCSLFKRPFNIYNLLSYLQVRIHPLPVKLRRELIRVIIEEGGIVNSEWNKTISEYLEEEADEKNKRKDTLEKFLPLVNSHSEDPSYKEFSEYVKHLKSWANKLLVLIGEGKRNESNLVRQQLASLVSYCNAMITILGTSQEGPVDSSFLNSLILSVYKPSDYNNEDPCINSKKVIDSPAAFADHAGNIIWIDTHDKGKPGLKYSFLDNNEFEKLLELGLTPWSEEAQVEAGLAESFQALLNCSKSFTLITSGKKGSKPLHQGPVVVQLKAQIKNIDSCTQHNPIPSTEHTEINRVRLPGIPVSIDIGENNGLNRRISESYSSLDLLIQYPIDYVLNYNAGLTDSGVAQLVNEQRTLGNVAHNFVELLVEETGGEPDKMKTEISVNYEAMLNSSVLRKGAILLLEENTLLLKRFKLILKKSISNLISIITENGLKVIDSELEDETIIEGRFTLGAKIDLLLEDKNGDFIIFDLKWTSSKTYYSDILRENKALQLEIYSKVLARGKEEKDVVACGYFDIARGLLLTTSSLKGDNVVNINSGSDEDIFIQCLKSYDYRWLQFESGIIEMADKTKLEDIPYYNDTEANNLFPLKHDYQKKQLKSANIFTSYETLKGGLK